MVGLGVARGLAAHLPEGLQVLNREIVAREVEHGVQQRTSMAVGEHEAIPVGLKNGV